MMTIDQRLLWLGLLLLLAHCSHVKGAASGTQPFHRKLQQEQSPYLQAVLLQYYTNEELEEHLQDYVKRCGHIAKLSSIGKSVEDRKLWVLEISDHPGQEEAEPNVKYVGGVHGDEPSGRQLALALAEWLCSNYETSPEAKRVVNDMHLFLMPAMNPDGFAAKTRENRDGIDLNRDFPDRYNSGNPTLELTGSEQVETAWMAEWSKNVGFVAAASFHEGAVLANYPWDGTPNKTTQYWASPDDATFKHLAKTYAYAHKTMWQSKSFKDGITNGAAWYPIYGSMQDWSYVAGGTFELTLELSQSKWPPAHQLAPLWEENRAALLSFALTAALGGLRGTVKERVSQPGKAEQLLPLVANISILGIDYVVASKEKFGDFYRPLAPGQYGVMVSAEGYQPFSANVAIPEDGSGAVLDVVLTMLPGYVKPRADEDEPEEGDEGEEEDSKLGGGGEAGAEFGAVAGAVASAAEGGGTEVVPLNEGATAGGDSRGQAASLMAGAGAGRGGRGRVAGRKGAAGAGEEYVSRGLSMGRVRRRVQPQQSWWWGVRPLLMLVLGAVLLQMAVRKYLRRRMLVRARLRGD